MSIVEWLLEEPFAACPIVGPSRQYRTSTTTASHPPSHLPSSTSPDLPPPSTPPTSHRTQQPTSIMPTRASCCCASWCGSGQRYLRQGPWCCTQHPYRCMLRQLSHNRGCAPHEAGRGPTRDSAALRLSAQASPPHPPGPHRAPYIPHLAATAFLRSPNSVLASSLEPANPRQPSVQRYKLSKHQEKHVQIFACQVNETQTWR